MTRSPHAAVGGIMIGWFLIGASASWARTDSCSVLITSPATGTRIVGPDVTVSGKATVSAGNALWAFARKQGLATAWPQAGGSIVPDEKGDYSVLITLGKETETGAFDVWLQVVDSAQNARLEAWFRRAEATGLYPGMPVPPIVAGCGVPAKITVIKTA